MKNEQELAEMAVRMRLKALEMAYHAGKTGAHLGGGLSAIEILAVLYGAAARIDSENPFWDDRDRILISKAHCVLAYYTALQEAGFISGEELNTFEQNGGSLAGHPVKNIEKGIEYAGGSLGMALSVAAGMAVHAKNAGSRRRIYVLLGDGECEEGSVWEAFLFAANYRLNNITAIIDRNRLQYDGTTEEVAGLTGLADKIAAFGWKTVRADGHSVSELLQAYKSTDDEKPLAVIADTVKGKGVSFMENNPAWHHSELKKEMYEQAAAQVRAEGELCKRAGADK